jgi:Family of unknown function (DUF6263)
MSRTHRLSIFFVLFATLATGCKEDPKKSASGTPRAPEPIPSDFVVNGFFPAGSDQPPKVEIRTDGGSVALPVDGSATQTASSDDPGAGAAAPSGSPSNVKVLEPGEEPRVARKYELKAGKTENLSVTMRSTMSQEIPGQPAASQSQPGMVFTLALTPQAKADGGDFPIKVTFSRAEVLPAADLDPNQVKQMAQAFKMLVGQAGAFKLGAHGAMSGFALANEQLARTELGAIAQQTLDGLFVVLPDEPIGKGAKWEETGTTHQEGVTVTTTTTYTLKDVTPDGMAIAVATRRKAPAQPMADPRAPKGTSIAIDGTSSAQVKIRLERMPGKGAIDTATTITVTQGGGGPGAPPRAMQQKVSSKQTIDNNT